jgi:N-acetylglucosaminyldiphosphoundecaprenol N-acetyl-beta-D-mannosaminyltransferase
MTMEFINALGLRIAATDYDGAIAAMAGFIGDGRSHYVCLSNVHTVVESHFDGELKAAINAADLALPDGMPLVWLVRRAGHALEERVYGPDLMLRFCAATQDRGYRHFFYGGAEGVAAELAQRLKGLFPEMKIAGALSPPFRPLSASEEAQLALMVNDRVDVMWVGLGCPKQEKWMHTHRHLRLGAMVGVGAAFDFHTGRVSQAPRWMQRSGLEWLYRLTREPQRLWRRYLVFNSLFVMFYLGQRLGLWSYPNFDPR